MSTQAGAASEPCDGHSTLLLVMAGLRVQDTELHAWDGQVGREEGYWQGQHRPLCAGPRSPLGWAETPLTWQRR